MSADSIAVFIPIIALSIPIVAIWTRHQRKMAEMKIRQFTAQDEQQRSAGNDRAEWLEERVRVLERIVTDKGYDVSAQIEALRDPQSLEDRQMEKRS
ncbi:MAG: hypothetical protein KGL44_01735 [Sphingomonadales bacterium]|nr:hypothetical protein [Sphingomonadales bacterium]